MADEREQQIRARLAARGSAPKIRFTILNSAPCWRCGKPATAYYNLAATMSSGAGDDMRPVCDEHNPLLPIGPSSVEADCTPDVLQGDVGDALVGARAALAREDGGKVGAQ